jgi:hypothetical protein
VSHRYYEATVTNGKREWTMLLIARSMAHAEAQIAAMGLMLLYIVEDMG